jgi:hypothetical protein
MACKKKKDQLAGETGMGGAVLRRLTLLVLYVAVCAAGKKGVRQTAVRFPCSVPVPGRAAQCPKRSRRAPPRAVGAGGGAPRHPRRVLPRGNRPSRAALLTASADAGQDRELRTRRNDCERDVCTGLLGEVKLTCVYKCVSAECHEEVYGKDSVEALPRLFPGARQTSGLRTLLVTLTRALCGSSRRVRWTRSVGGSLARAFEECTRRSKSCGCSSSAKRSRRGSRSTTRKSRSRLRESANKVACDKLWRGRARWRARGARAAPENQTGRPNCT